MCPECGVATTFRGRPELFLLIKRLPPLAVLGVLLVHAVLALVPGLQGGPTATPWLVRAALQGGTPKAAAYFVEPRWTLEDLRQAAAASPGIGLIGAGRERSGKTLARDILHVFQDVPSDGRQFAFAIVPPVGTVDWTQSRGWPFPREERYFWKEHASVFVRSDEHPPGGLPAELSTSSWRSALWSEPRMQRTTVHYAPSRRVSVLPWIFGLLAAATAFETCRLLVGKHPGSVRRRLPAAAGLAALAACVAANMLHGVKGQETVQPMNAFGVGCGSARVNGAWLNEASLRALTGNEREERALAEGILAAVPAGVPEDGALVVRGNGTMPSSVWTLALSPGSDLLWISWYSDQTPAGASKPLDACGTQIEQDGQYITITFPRRAGATTGYWALLDLEGVTLVWMRAVIALYAAAFVRWVWARRVRARRIARGRCVACGYQLKQ